MDNHLLLTLLRKLIDLCRRCARQSLHCLLRIFSALSLRRRSVLGDNEKVGERKNPESTTYFGARQDDRCETAVGPVVLACSSTPRRPPPARTYTRYTSMDSYNTGPACVSPTSTLHDSPGSMSPSSIDNQRHLTRELSSPPETLIADPAGLIAPPEKPIKSTLPSLTSRYDRNIAIKNDRGPWIFGPLETFTVYDELAVPSWTYYTQPEGQLYFRKDFGRFQYLTEEHLSDPESLAEAELFISVFERKADAYKNLPNNVEVVLEVSDGYWLYYMVDLDRRCMFWLDDCIVDDSVLPGNFGVEHREHFRHMFDFEFWQHIAYFPNHRPLQKGLLEELMGILVHTHIDVVTSVSSTSAHTEEELDSLIRSVKHLQALQTNETALPYVVESSARLMAIMSNERFFNFTGFHGARLSGYQSVRGNVAKKRSPLIKTLSPILFYAPEIHLVGLEKVWVDEVVKVRHWRSFQSKIERDWEGFVLYATVLVNANVAFLAIPSIISDDLGPGLMMSPAGVVSQVSIVASLGSIIIGLLLVRQMRIGTKETVEDYLAFLQNRTRLHMGLETLAILYSLPYALLMWGMATFLAAVAIACFYSMGGSVSLAKRLIYGVVWLFVLVLIAWTVVTGWEKKWRWRFRMTRGSTSGKVASGSEEMELDTLDAQSMRSRRSVRSRLTASSTVASSIGHSWRTRMHRLGEQPRSYFSWRSASAGSRTTLPAP